MAVLASRFTLASTPSMALRAFSTWAWQWAHIMPLMLMVLVIALVPFVSTDLGVPSETGAAGDSRRSGRKNLRRRALDTTHTEDRLMAAAPNMGESWSWNRGYHTPAARGMPIML